MRSSRPGKILDRPIATNRVNFRHHLNEQQKPGKICPSGDRQSARFTATRRRGDPHRSNGTEAPKADWRTWLLLAGRGFGKTRSGAECIRDQVIHQRRRRIALVAPTAADARDVMVEGESGLLAIGPPQLIASQSSW